MRLEIKKNAIKGTFWGTISKLISLFFPFVIRTIIIRRLGSEYAGLSSLFTSILQVLSLTELGFGTAMVFAMYQPIAEDNIIKQRAVLNFYRKIYFYIGLTMLVAGLAIAPFLGFFINGAIPQDINLYILYLIYLSNTVLSYFMFGYRSAIFSAYQRQDLISIVSMISNFVMYGLQIILLLTARNYYFFAVCLPLSTIMTNVFTYKLSEKYYPQIYPEGDISNEDKNNIYHKIKALLLHKIGGIILNSADTIVISVFLGLIILSNYNNYYYLINAVSGIIVILFSTLTAGIGNSLIIDNGEQKKEKFYNILYINGLIVSVCTCCFFSMYQDFIRVWVGNDKCLDYGIMILFCVYFYIHMIRRTILMYRDAAGLWEANKWQPIVSGGFNLIVNILLVQYVGVYGILISSILAQVLIDIPWESGLTTYSLLGEKPLKYYSRIILFSIATCCSMIITGLLVQSVVINVYFKLLIELACSLICSGIIFLGMTFYLPEFKKTFSKIIVRKLLW